MWWLESYRVTKWSLTWPKPCGILPNTTNFKPYFIEKLCSLFRVWQTILWWNGQWFSHGLESGKDKITYDTQPHFKFPLFFYLVICLLPIINLSCDVHVMQCYNFAPSLCLSIFSTILVLVGGLTSPSGSSNKCFYYPPSSCGTPADYLRHSNTL